MSGSTVVSKAAVVRKLAKPGWKTSELATAVAAFAAALATLLGAFNVNSAIGNAVIKLGALVAAGITAAGYAHARAATKSALGSVIVHTADSGSAVLDVVIGAVLIIIGVSIALIAGKAPLVFCGVVVAVTGLVLLVSGPFVSRSIR